MGNNTNPATALFAEDAAQHILRTEGGRHALEKIMECSLRCIARARINTEESVGPITMGQEPLPRDLLQIGYNLGRLSELTGAGRAVWDSTKQFVVDGDYEGLFNWALEIAGPVEGGADQ